MPRIRARSTYAVFRGSINISKCQRPAETRLGWQVLPDVTPRHSTCGEPWYVTVPDKLRGPTK
jgi:hypothetical protein